MTGEDDDARLRHLLDDAVQQCERVEAIRKIDIEHDDRWAHAEYVGHAIGKTADAMQSSEARLEGQPTLQRIDKLRIVVDAHQAERLDASVVRSAECVVATTRHRR